MRAIDQCDGTLSVVDREAQCYKRSWCGYEVWVSLASKPNASYRYDMYTSLGDRGVGLTHGITPTDQSRKAIANTMKAKRESEFPLSMVDYAFAFDICKTSASQSNDRKHILNSITALDLDAEPLTCHQKFDELNKLLRGRFAAATWRLTLESRSDNMERHAHALSESGLRALHISLGYIDHVVDSDVSHLWSALPTSLQKFEVSFLGCETLSDLAVESIAQGLAKVPRLKTLKLSLSFCSNLTDTSARTLGHAFKLLPELSQLKLWMQRTKVTAEGIKSIAEGLSQQVATEQSELSRNLFLDFIGCDLCRGQAEMALTSGLGRQLCWRKTPPPMFESVADDAPGLVKLQSV